MSATAFFARVSAGLERVAWQEIARLPTAELIGFGHRRVDFVYSGAPADLLGLRAVDDVYALAGRLAGLDHTRVSLDRLTQKLAYVDFGPALATVAAARALPEYPRYRVTASHLGRRNYSRYDVEGAVEKALTPRLPWRFVLNDADEPEPELDLRVLLEDDWALLGLRLGAAPLHRREYKVASRTGSLKAPVAYCLALLAGMAPGRALLDPACGAGTILAEATALAPDGALVGGDVDAGALDLARANLAELGIEPRAIEPGLAIDPREGPAGVTLYLGDARAIPLAAGSVDAVASNLPWGQQVAVEDDMAGLYAGVLGEVARVLAPGGRAALLTDQAAAMQAALDAHPALRLAEALPISLFGRHPSIYVLEQAAESTDVRRTA
jgi:23S rRNA G2445 N2-methylase RlmL